MYGTVARMRTRPGSEEQLTSLAAEYDTLDVPGFVATYLYRLDDNENEYYMAVLFEDRESYRRNAEDPAQDERYRRMRELLEADPKWHDGEVVWASGR
jgi:heme-degrading monooxygenase HmoA